MDFKKIKWSQIKWKENERVINRKVETKTIKQVKHRNKMRKLKNDSSFDTRSDESNLYIE